MVKEYIENFLLEARSHSGLPLVNNISTYYTKVLSSIPFDNTPDEMMLDEFLNKYLIYTHELYKKTKTWKSYNDF